MAAGRRGGCGRCCTRRMARPARGDSWRRFRRRRSTIRSHNRVRASVTLGPGLFADSIGKSFRGRAVVSNVSLRLNRGEVVGLLGPNGAGKTTCFYMVIGLIAADYGAIYLDGQDITGQPMYQRARMGVGYLPQEPSVFRGMTVEQN